VIALLLPALALAAPLLPAPRGEAGPPVRWTAAPLEVSLAPGEECGLALRLPLMVLAEGWVQVPVVGPELVLSEARLDGRPVRLAGHDSGLTLLARLPAGPHLLSLSGTVACASDRLLLRTPLGGPARLEVTGEERSWTVENSVHTGDRRWDLAPAPALSAAWAPPREPPPRPRVFTHDTVVGLRVDEGGIEGRALVRQTVAHGSQDAVVVSIPGGVQEAWATGPGVVEARVQGERVTVVLQEPVEGTVEVDLGWRAAAPGEDGARAPVPQPVEGRGQTAVVVVQGDDSVLLPEPGPGLEAVPMRRVGRRARGLVPGEPLVVYLSKEGKRPELRLRQLRFSPVDAPPTVIDKADYTVTYAEHGRAWMRATWQVRNDRNPFLRVDVPEGWRVFGLRVAGATAEPVRDESGALLVPLEKSVETLEGLVAFPVELMLVGEDAAWEARGRRALQTPTVDAPIAMARWELRLPDGLQPKEAEGRGTVVSQWTPEDTGLMIGRASKRPPPADPAQQGQQLSQEYWNQAYSAYKANAFDQADALLQKSLEANPDNPSAQSLMGNLDVLKNRVELDKDAQVAANRVRAMAKARSGDTVLAQAEKEQALERALRSGNEDEAARVADELLVLTSQLAAVEQVEAVEQKARLSSYQVTAAKLGKKKGKAEEKRAVRADGPASGASFATAPPPPPPPPAEASTTTFDFEDVEISGELVKPEGALVLDRKKAEFSPLIRTPDLAGKISETSEVDGDFGEPAPMAEPEPAEELVLESPVVADGWLDESELEYVEGGVAGGVVGGVVGGVYGAVLGGAVASEGERAEEEESKPAEPPPPRVMALKESVLQHAEIVVTESDDDSGADGDELDLRNIPMGRSYQEAVTLAAGVGGRWRDAHRPARDQRPQAAEPPPARFPVDLPAAPARPVHAPPGGAFPVDTTVLTGPPVHAPPAADPVRPVVDTTVPVRAPAAPPPVRAAAPPALPRRPAPPPPAPFGLDIPDKVVASTLSLSLPEGGARLLLEQRVIPPGEPLRVELRYRPTRR
jgi:hypothetical protein